MMRAELVLVLSFHFWGRLRLLLLLLFFPLLLSFFPFFIAAVNTQSIVLPVIAPFVVVTDFVLSFVFFSLFAAVPFF
jgi:hypothetical protein